MSRRPMARFKNCSSSGKFGLPVPVHFVARGVVHEQFAALQTLLQRELRLVSASPTLRHLTNRSVSAP